MNHEECSELLRPYLEGELAAPEADAVRSHLEGCPQCRAEATAVGELIAPSSPLTAAESEELRSAILTRLDQPTRLSERRSLRTERRTWGWAQLAAAAAVLIVGAVFVRTTGLPGSSGGADSAAVGEADVGGGAEQVADVQDRLRFQRPDTTLSADAPVADAAQTESLEAAAGDGTTDRFAPKDGGTAESGGGGSQASGKRRVAGYQGPPRPLLVRDAGRLSDRRLTLVGRYGLPLVLFPQAYTTEDAANLQEDYLVALANAAGEEAQSQQIIDCGAQVLSQTEGVLPGLATFGELDGEAIFLLAFAWTEADQGPLDRYMVWTWPAGDCNSIPGYRAGRIGV